MRTRFSRYFGNAVMLCLMSLALACGGKGKKGSTGDPGADGLNGDAGPQGQEGDRGATGTSCTAEDNGDGSATVTCTDGTTATIDAGAAGVDGTSCTTADNGNGTSTITCGDTSVTVASGTNGQDGTNCTIVNNNDGTATITCGDNSVTITSGADGINGINGTNGTNGTNGDGCTVEDNGDGTVTVTCGDNTVTIANGTNGTNGTNGKSGGNVEVGNFHGLDTLLSTGEFANGAKDFVKATITSATADANGVLTVEFSVEDADGDPVDDVPRVSGSIVKLDDTNNWVPYINRTETVEAGAWGDGGTAYQANRENDGTLTNNGDGTYTYEFSTDLSDAEIGGTSISYDRDVTHRVSIMMGGHSGHTADANFDFVPDGSDVTETRDIVGTGVCMDCHGPLFDGHGGDRLTVENCVTCHNPGVDGNLDANSGETIDMKVMIHKIHAGAELPSVEAGGEYAIWGHNDSKHSWGMAEFPAVLSNCTKCHTGDETDLPDVDNWKENPTRAACGSCHDDVNFEDGTNHDGPGAPGAQANDNNCNVCHSASKIVEVHDWTTKDLRNIAEFDVELTVSDPDNGDYFTGTETPVLTIVLKDPVTGNVIDPSGFTADDTAEGCTVDDDPCPAADGQLATQNLYVNGPRAHRMPVLTNAAQAALSGYTTSDKILDAAVLSSTDMTYTLNSVEGLPAGTYTAYVEIGDRGRLGADDYVTPSIGRVNFQVGTATEELPIARACNTCHQNDDGVGYVLDYSRHNKKFDDLAVDGCGSCHDYANNDPTSDHFYGGLAISRRVHAVHNGSNLTDPVGTVGHSDGVPGRDWNITYPQDIRNCESCHVEGETTDTWMTNPNRLACGGCHDSVAVQAHMALSTVDPTPDAPYSGDELESCATCH